MEGKTLVFESLDMLNKSRNRKRLSFRNVALVSLSLCLLLLNSTAIVSQTDQEQASNSEEIASTDEANPSSADEETDNGASARPTQDESNADQSDAENQSAVDSSKEESSQTDEDGSDEEDIVEIFNPSEEISEDISVPFPVDI